MATENKSKSEGLFHLWTSQENIEMAAKNYSKWYVSCRFIPVLCLFLFELISILLGFNDKNLLWFICFMYLPFMFLSAHGYRWAIITVLILFTLNTLGYFIIKCMMSEYIGHFSGKGIFTKIIIWLVLSKEMISAIRIETYRKKHKLTKNQNTLQNSVIALLLFIIPLSLFTKFGMNNVFTYQEKAEEVFKNMFGYLIYCEKNGYKMTKYPVVYFKTFKDEITDLRDTYKRETGQTIMDAMNRNFNILSIDSEVDELKQHLQKIHQKEYTTFDVCKWFDDNAEQIVENLKE